MKHEIKKTTRDCLLCGENMKKTSKYYDIYQCKGCDREYAICFSCGCQTSVVEVALDKHDNLICPECCREKYFCCIYCEQFFPNEEKIIDQEDELCKDCYQRIKKRRRKEKNS